MHSNVSTRRAKHVSRLFDRVGSFVNGSDAKHETDQSCKVPCPDLIKQLCNFYWVSPHCVVHEKLNGPVPGNSPLRWF